jgi:hypothetical protein
MRSLADMLGTDKDATTFAGVKLLGRNAEEALADFNKLGFGCTVTKHKDIACNRVPAMEWSIGGWGSFDATADEAGLIKRYHVYWSLDSASSKLAVLDVYKKKWGEPENELQWRVYSDSPRVQADMNSAALSVSLEAPPPAP